jgi:hypothetical protein
MIRRPQAPEACALPIELHPVEIYNSPVPVPFSVDDSLRTELSISAFRAGYA